MTDAQRVHRQLAVTKLYFVFAVLAVSLVGLLSVVPWQESDREWRAIQRRYDAEATARGDDPIPIEIRQIVHREGDVVDRCTTCHLGMGEAPPIEGSAVFGRHPEIPHDPREFGCTPCHGGKGRATTTDAAHGHEGGWTSPMLDRPYFEAGCGHCHSHVRIPDRASVDEGANLFEERKCVACHAGEADALGPALATAGLSGFDPVWHDRHRDHVGEAERGPWVDLFEPLIEEELPPIEAFMSTRIGAPRLFAGKTLAHRLGCRGCHRIAGVGGDAGPDLSDVATRLLTDRNYSKIEDPSELPAWLRRHFLDPESVIPDSEMPALDLDADGVDALTLYVMSLRGNAIPEAWVPRDRARGLRLKERDFGTSGEDLFAAFCSGCHGPEGEGRRFGRWIDRYPSVTSADFLGLVSDDNLRSLVARGRPGRRMPAFGEGEAGLRPDEISRIVSFLRAAEPPMPDSQAVALQPRDVALGEALYLSDCAACHGPDGEGTRIGPPLAAADNPVTGNFSAVFGTLAIGISDTAMGSFRRYDTAELAALIASIRAMPRLDLVREEWKAAVVGAADERGAALYHDHCSDCHGAEGEGGIGPSLANEGLLRSISDGTLIATIVRGRSGTDMPAFGRPSLDNEALDDGQVLAVVAYLRGLVPPDEAPTEAP